MEAPDAAEKKDTSFGLIPQSSFIDIAFFGQTTTLCEFSIFDKLVCRGTVPYSLANTLDFFFVSSYSGYRVWYPWETGVGRFFIIIFNIFILACFCFCLVCFFDHACEIDKLKVGEGLAFACGMRKCTTLKLVDQGFSLNQHQFLAWFLGELFLLL